MLARDLSEGDELYRQVSVTTPILCERDNYSWLLGLLLCDSSYAGSCSISLGSDETDICDKAMSILTGLGFKSKVKNQERGNKGTYKDLYVCNSSSLCLDLFKQFKGSTKVNRQIPDAIWDGTPEEKLSFIAGMIDADGYVNTRGNLCRVQIGTTNEKLAYEQMLLAIDVGLNAVVYQNHYNSSDRSKIRYRVEFNCPPELARLLVSGKKRKAAVADHTFYQNVVLNSDVCSVANIEPHTIEKYSYDVTTETEHFSVNGIYSHNCRSFLTDWIDPETGKYKYEGRFNQGVVSINLPQIALTVTNGGSFVPDSEDEFWNLLDERLDLCYDALMCRHNALMGTKSDISPIHWQNGAIARLKSGETIDRYLLNNYSTISLGYIGVFETTKLMKGCSQTTPIGEDFAIRLMTYLRDTCNKWKQETGIGFSLYGTPAESLCYRFARIDKEKFGDVKDVTDKGYYTNSYHIDVRENIDAFTKFTIESKFQRLSPGGAISYVEIPNMRHNLTALKDLVRFIYDNIQYAEFNTKSDYCQVCGYDGEVIINDDLQWECPNCGNKDKHLLNVTRRTCGYLGENFWNVGKTKEIKDRVLHL